MPIKMTTNSKSMEKRVHIQWKAKLDNIRVHHGLTNPEMAKFLKIMLNPSNEPLSKLFGWNESRQWIEEYIEKVEKKKRKRKKIDG